MNMSRAAGAPIRVAFFLSLVFLFGCQVKTEILNPAKPLALVGKTCPGISVGNIVTDPQVVQSEVGHNHQGLMALPNKQNTGAVAVGACPLAVTEVEAELREAGYAVVGGDRARLFDNQSQDRERSAYQIGGIITHLKYDNFDSVGGVGAISEATVNWKVMDQRSRKIVYETTTTGKAKGAAQEIGAIAGAVRGSCKLMLADPQFVTIVTR